MVRLLKSQSGPFLINDLFFKSNTGGAGTAYPYGVHEFASFLFSFEFRFAQTFSLLCSILSTSIRVFVPFLLAIAIYVPLRLLVIPLVSSKYS